MAYFFRLVLKTLLIYAFIIGLGFISNAKAAGEYRAVSTNQYHDSFQLACWSMIAPTEYAAGRIYDSVVLNSTNANGDIYGCRYKRTSDGNVSQVNSGWTVQLMRCTSPLFWNSSTHTCTAPPTCTPPQVNNPTTGVCQNPPTDCTDGKILDSGTYSTTETPANTGCVNGCTAIFVGTAPQISCGFGSSGIGSCTLVKTGRYNSTGSNCSPDNAEKTPALPPNPTTPEYDCIQKGQTFGTVNGQTVCLPIGTPNTPTPPKTVDAVKQKTVTNPDGTKTTTTTTTTINNNNQVTSSTTTTTTNADGSNPQTSTTSKNQDKQGFCEENPNLKICGEDENSKFSGSCEIGTFTCDGDAIQCAIAKKQHESRCEDLKEGPIAEQGEKVLDGSDATEFIESSGLETILDVPTDLDYDSFFPETCPSDLHIPFGDRVVTLPFSKLCGAFALMGQLIMIFAYLTAFRIVARAI